MKEIEYYIHIPFCVRKCHYCDFLSFPMNQEGKHAYLDRLCEEIRQFDLKQEYEISTIFIGGGTPSILTPEETERYMNAIRENHAISSNAEITMEANPGTLSEEKLDCYRKLGINRLSMGVQSFDDQELKMLGRIHSSEDIYRSFEMARRCGFQNINLDLMSALPGQKEDDFLKSLNRAIALQPEHISAYSLIIEEGTPFYERYAEDEVRKEEGEIPLYLPSEEEDRRIYHKTKEVLLKYGYEQYEISNYAKPQMACRHNLGYWERKEYRGFGLGAASFLNQRRFTNQKEFVTYLNNVVTEEEIDGDILSLSEQMEETMFLGLRLMQGVQKDRFYQLFGVSMEEVYGAQIQDMTGKGLLINGEKKIRLTEKGIDLANYVMSEFLK